MWCVSVFAVYFDFNRFPFRKAKSAKLVNIKTMATAIMLPLLASLASNPLGGLCCDIHVHAWVCLILPCSELLLREVQLVPQSHGFLIWLGDLGPRSWIGEPQSVILAPSSSASVAVHVEFDDPPPIPQISLPVVPCTHPAFGRVHDVGHLISFVRCLRMLLITSLGSDELLTLL